MGTEDQRRLLSALLAEPLVHQTPPDYAAWTTWLMLGGRGAGKTFAGAHWITLNALAYPMLALVGPTLHDVREVMIEGPSGLKALGGPAFRPRWEASRRRLIWPNGAVAYAFSAEDPDSLRGPQFHAAWADEFCAWPKPAETLAMLRFGLRLGEDPRLVVTSTPRPIRALKALIAEPGARVTRAGTSANAAHLAPAFLRTLESLYYMGLKVMRNPDLTSEELHVAQWEPYEEVKSEVVSALGSLKALLAWMEGHQLEVLNSSTQIIIAPGYDYKIVKMLVTNFHQPQSTLLLLVSAFVKGDWHKIYDYALAHDFRFLSYGDSSLLIP